MPDGMSRMIQMLSVLADIQSKRRELDQRDAQIETSKQQFAQSLGLQEKSAEYKKVGDLLDAIARSSSEARGGIVELAGTVGIDPKQAEALAHFAQSAPETLEALKNTAATQGYRNQNATQLQRETAATNMTGMNLGGMQQSGLIQQLAARQPTQQMQQDFNQYTANRSTPLQSFIEGIVRGSAPMSNRMAGVMAGTQQSAGSAAQAAVGHEQNLVGMAGVRQRAIENEMDVAAKIATARGAGAVTPQVLMEGFGKLLEQHKEITNPKATEAARVKAKAEYNYLADVMGLPDLKWTDGSQPTVNGIVGRMQSTIMGPQSGNPAPQSYQPPPATPTSPFMQTPNPLQQQQNPINWFSRPQP